MADQLNSVFEEADISDTFFWCSIKKLSDESVEIKIIYRQLIDNKRLNNF